MQQYHKSPCLAGIQEVRHDLRAKNTDLVLFRSLSKVGDKYTTLGRYVNVCVTCTFSPLTGIDSVVASRISLNVWTLGLIKRTLNRNGFVSSLTDSSAAVRFSVVSANTTASSTNIGSVILKASNDIPQPDFFDIFPGTWSLQVLNSVEARSLRTRVLKGK